MSIKLFEQASVLSRTFFFFALVTIVFVALCPNLKLPPMIIGIKLSDEFYHILAFTTLTLIALQVWSPSLPLMLLLVLFALGLEFAQVAIPGRAVELSDIVASLSGVALGGIVSSAPRRLRRAFRRGTGAFQGLPNQLTLRPIMRRILAISSGRTRPELVLSDREMSPSLRPGLTIGRRNEQAAIEHKGPS